MKQQNNITKHIAPMMWVAAFVITLCACTDNDLAEKNIEEGHPVEISISYATPEMTTVSTRGLDEDLEKKVNDLYILIFNENGSVRKKGSGLYKVVQTQNSAIQIETTSGKSLIYAVANVLNNQQANLEIQLDNVQNLEALNNCVITTNVIDKIIDVDRTSPNLVMSGAYVGGNQTGKDAGYCEIYTTPQTQSLEGAIELIHLDSSIQFNIYTGSKVTKFEPKEWQVCNVPKQSFILPHKNNTTPGGTNPSLYANSYKYNNQNIHAKTDAEGKKMHTFRFYQFENFKNAKEGLDKPEDREKEVKINDRNSGTFAYVDSCATYIELKAYMELTTEEGISRIADFKITVLLGGVDPGKEYDFRNFNTWRNKRYTYKITINDVNDIVKEVTDNDEKRPGLEGDVIDAQGPVRILDSHYNCFNITLTAAEVEEMSILVHTPFDDVLYEVKNGKQTSAPDKKENRDYKWIKFKYLTSIHNSIKEAYPVFAPLATYTTDFENPDDDLKNERLDIFSLRDDVKKRKRYPAEKHCYTVFVDEYYYDKAPNGKQWKSPLWVNFVNLENRYVMLTCTPEKSKDQESSYSKPQYFITQKAIQTYYSETTLTSDQTALGMEHANETPDPIWIEQAINLDNGYLNCSNYISSKGGRWKAFAYKSDSPSSGFDYFCITNNDQNTFSLSTHNLNAQCLSRNRDKNGNGTIEEDEMEWYVPTFKQISGMYLGATSLVSPLFTPPSDGKVKFDDLAYHFLTSDGDKIWAQEGCSNKGSGGKQIRCVRNLGLSASASKERAPLKPYDKNKPDGIHYVFDMRWMKESNIRPTVANTLGFHDNFQSTQNKPYKKFELAEFFSNTKYPKGTYTWDVYNTQTNATDLCQEYYENGENDPVRGKTKWRTPNQRELLIIHNLLGVDAMCTKINGIDYGMYSSTYWPFYHWTDANGKSGYRIFGIQPKAKKLYLDNVKANYVHKSEEGSILRCVRDISD